MKDAESGATKAYGAGLLSSFGEIEWACKDYSISVEAKGTTADWDYTGGKTQPLISPWDPRVASNTKYPITTYQPRYFLAER